MISEPGVDCAVLADCEPGQGSSSRAVAPSLPDWRIALWTALLAVELVALGALLVVMEPGW